MILKKSIQTCFSCGYPTNEVIGHLYTCKACKKILHNVKELQGKEWQRQIIAVKK